MAKLPVKSLPLIGIVLFLAAIGFFLIKSERKEPEKITIDETVPAEDISSKKFNVTQMDSDKGITWTLESDGGDYSLEDRVGRFKKFRIKLHAEDGLDFELEGNSGEYNNEKNEIQFSGELKGQTSNGYMIYTDHLMLQGKDGSLKSDEDVTFVGPFFKITGRGLFMDLKKEKLKIMKDVNSTFDKESLTI